MQFSDLTLEFPDTPNPLYARLELLKSRNVNVVDMVRTNPNDIGIAFPERMLDEILAAAWDRARSFRPDSLGQLPAREAISAGYPQGRVPPDQILLTPGTSVSYWYAFKLLCNPGDNVLCPIPSYPLFDYIARLSGVELSAYHLNENAAWRIDLEHLEHQVMERTRAIVLISPHNPTGMVCTQAEIDGIAEIARRHRLAILADEVFANFTFGNTRFVQPLGTGAPLVFTLNGFSKKYALPGLKLGWMAVSGDDALVRKSMETLELISDTFLPVNEPAQFAAPAIIEEGSAFAREYRGRVQTCRDVAVELLGPAIPSPPAGGFYMVIPCEGSEEDVAMTLLDEDHILVHPGYFYDIDGRHLVISFLLNRETLSEVLPQIRNRAGGEGVRPNRISPPPH